VSEYSNEWIDMRHDNARNTHVRSSPYLVPYTRPGRLLCNLRSSRALPEPRVVRRPRPAADLGRRGPRQHTFVAAVVRNGQRQPDGFEQMVMSLIAGPEEGCDGPVQPKIGALPGPPSALPRSGQPPDREVRRLAGLVLGAERG
jgi:hypothetical protein